MRKYQKFKKKIKKFQQAYSSSPDNQIPTLEQLEKNNILLPWPPVCPKIWTRHLCRNGVPG